MKPAACLILFASLLAVVPSATLSAQTPARLR